MQSHHHLYFFISASVLCSYQKVLRKCKCLKTHISLCPAGKTASVHVAGSPLSCILITVLAKKADALALCPGLAVMHDALVWLGHFWGLYETCHLQYLQDPKSSTQLKS